MLDQLTARGTLYRAFERVRENGGCRGADGMTVGDFAARLEEEIDRLEDRLLRRVYHPFPLLRLAIPKPTSGMRHLSIPTVRDRVVQTAVDLVHQGSLREGIRGLQLCLPVRPLGSIGHPSHSRVARPGLWLGGGCDRRRTKLAHNLKDFGVRVQYSVFECILEAEQVEALRARIARLIDPSEDRVRIYRFCEDCGTKTEFLGLSEPTEDRDVYVL